MVYLIKPIFYHFNSFFSRALSSIKRIQVVIITLFKFSRFYYILVLLKKTHWDNIIRSWSNELLFVNYYFIIVHNKTIIKRVYMNICFNKVWYIVKWFLVNIFSLQVVFDWNKHKTRIIWIHHFVTWKNHR